MLFPESPKLLETNDVLWNKTYFDLDGLLPEDFSNKKHPYDKSFERDQIVIRTSAEVLRAKGLLDIVTYTGISMTTNWAFAMLNSSKPDAYRWGTLHQIATIQGQFISQFKYA